MKSFVAVIMTKESSVAADEAVGYFLVLIALGLGVLMVLILAEASSASFRWYFSFFAANVSMWLHLLLLHHDLLFYPVYELHRMFLWLCYRDCYCRGSSACGPVQEILDYL